ncbi:hypothetical protein LS684_21290 (plasmid) [Cytobacillus spongiae]|uniref:hypothetical protein n=1 Tax=Cytobacillus spongiae TaxID=2901381 RepID=UPI001F45FFAF|nr:hypothetical protein [Cytobacillus spongiae]UII58157.1 hypothetical protein LS684_21290 [Cytobacillus spongiae]
MRNNVEKMGQMNVASIANKYLDKAQSKVTDFASEVSFNKYEEKAEANRENAVIKLKSGQTVNVTEGSMLYEKVKNYAQSNFLMINSERFLNPSEIAEFIDIDFSIDYSTKDIKVEEEDIDKNWRSVFYPDEDQK